MYWNRPLTAEELEAHYKLTESLDPAFARQDRAFWESRTRNQLSALRHQAWMTNDRDQYCMAQTYLERC